MKTTYRPLFSAWRVAYAELQDRQRMVDEALQAGVRVEDRDSQTVQALLDACQGEEREVGDGK